MLSVLMDRLIRQWRLFMDVHIVILDYHYRILSAFWTFNFHLCSRLPLTEPATAIRTHSVFHIKTSFPFSVMPFINDSAASSPDNPEIVRQFPMIPRLSRYSFPMSISPIFSFIHFCAPYSIAFSFGISHTSRTSCSQESI